MQGLRIVVPDLRFHVPRSVKLSRPVSQPRQCKMEPHVFPHSDPGSGWGVVTCGRPTTSAAHKPFCRGAHRRAWRGSADPLSLEAVPLFEGPTNKGSTLNSLEFLAFSALQQNTRNQALLPPLSHSTRTSSLFYLASYLRNTREHEMNSSPSASPGPWPPRRPSKRSVRSL